MSFITNTELIAYCGSSGINDSLISIYINTAEDIIIDYLGFNPEEAIYTSYLSGIGMDCLLLPFHPITSLDEIRIDGVEYSTENFILDDFWIHSIDGTVVFTTGINNIYVKFTAGYSVIPDVIKLTALRIASLLHSEANGNIGITNKTFSDGSRTFLNYTNFNKYLQALNSIRAVRF